MIFQKKEMMNILMVMFRISALYKHAAIIMCVLTMACFLEPAVAQGGAPDLLTRKWPAQWIAHPTASLTDYGVFHFRKTIHLKETPITYVIHISADNRYRLFVNGTETAMGPARGDLNNWRFETIDIAGMLRAGSNTVAVVVWNFGEYNHLAQASHASALIVQGNTELEEAINTGNDWKVYRNPAYRTPIVKPRFTTVGPPEVVDATNYPHGWSTSGYDDSDWLPPKPLEHGVPRGKATGWQWGLVPRGIPTMRHEKERFATVARSGDVPIFADFLQGSQPITIAANSRIKLLLDQGHLSTAYPELRLSGGAGAKLALAYAEALVDSLGEKGNRNEISGKHMVDYLVDVYYPDGAADRFFQPLWFRTYRYLELTVETADDPITIADVYGYARGYPFEEQGHFKSDDLALDAIWRVGWRTARLCAGEIYYDCPYYEQLQYIGDTRIQALISFYVAGDDRLARNAIDLFRQSIQPNGLTQSRYPSSEFQVIPPFSLLWVGMVHDYWMHRPDTAFVREQLRGVSQVLHWFNEQVDHSGLLGPMDYWNFVDWSFQRWRPDVPVGGTPPGAIEGQSSVLSLQYANGLQQAAELFSAFGHDDISATYATRAERLLKSVYAHCWDAGRGLLGDTPQKAHFSEHANSLAVLAGMFSPAEGQAVLARLAENEAITPATFYFKFYVFRAMKRLGVGDAYLAQLQPWHDMIAMGLTTFAETPEPTRSDCHAWSAHPIYDLLATVCGITPSAPGYISVRIAPSLGPLNEISGRAMHPAGAIEVRLRRVGRSGLSGSVSLPEGVRGTFCWQGEEFDLTGGKNEISI